MKISLSELAEVKGIGQKTIERIREYKLADEGYISEYDESLHLERNSINQGDCLELMNGIPDKSVDMILADLPYGTTACSWDSIIDLDKLWLQYERVIKDNGAIVLTASQPFTTKLINSNIKLFKYEWIWKKPPFNFLNSSHQPLRNHENVVVFCKNKSKFNRQKIEKIKYKTHGKSFKQTESVNDYNFNYKEKEGYAFPTSIINHIKKEDTRNIKHPTQKPVALFEYLIKTYTDEGDLVLDNTAGSGTTGVAAQNTNRDYILIEQDEEYCNICKERVGKLSDE